MKTKINLDEIRDSITSLMRKNCCGASDVTAEEIKIELNINGSNSTSGPLIRSMLDEAILAENLDYSKLSNRLKAAFMAELRSVADDVSIELRKQLVDSAQLNDELRELNSTHCTELAEIKLKSSEDQTQAKEKISCLEQAYAGSEAKASTFGEVKHLLISQLDETKTDIAERREEIGLLKNDLKSSQDRETITVQRVEDLSVKLSKSEVDIASEVLRRDRAEQKVIFLEERVTDLKTDKNQLGDLNTKLTADVDQLRGDLLIAAEAKAGATARLDEISRSSLAPRSTRTRQNTEKGAKTTKTGS